MIYWATATVTDCISKRHGLQILNVTLDDGTHGKAYHFTDHWPEIGQGQRVLLNTTAVELKLGTGGFHFVNAVLDDKANHDALAKTKVSKHIDEQSTGHLMKLRYTPQQRAVLAVEEEASPFHAIFTHNRTLEGLPVLIGELHSMLPIAVCWLMNIHRRRLAQLAPSRRSTDFNIVYIASDGAALPLILSDHVRTLRDLGWLRGTVTYGHAYGGDLEAINKFTALLAAKHIMQADVVIMAMGPGIAGTGTKMGHTGVEVGEIINAVSILGGKPIIMPRISFAEKRVRHYGLSHHTLSSLGLIALRPAVLPMPNVVSSDHLSLLKQQLGQDNILSKHDILWMEPPSLNSLKASLQDYPLPITTMGRAVDDDPVFFQSICIAAQTAYGQERRT